MEDINIVIGDVHTGRNSNNLVTFSYTELFFNNQVIKKCEEFDKNKIPFSITFMGDTFHSESLISSYIASRLSKLIKRMSGIEHCMSINFLVGNHDTWTKKSNDENSANIFISNSKVNVIYDYIVLKTPSGKSCAMISHCADENKFLDFVNSDNSDYIFMHQEIQGFLYKGENSISLITLEFLKKYQRIYNGHIHASTQVKNLINTGSIEQNNFGEENNVTGFFVSNLKTNSNEFIFNFTSPVFKRFKYSDIKDKNKKELDVLFNKKETLIYCSSEEEHYNCQFLIQNIETALSIKPVKAIFKETYEEDKIVHELKSLSESVEDTAIRLIESKLGQDFKGFLVTKSVVETTVKKIKEYHEKII